MATDILTQAEIDALLTSVSEDETKKQRGAARDRITEVAGKKTVRVYDFSSPDKFSKEQVRTLQMLHEGFARLLNNSMSAYLRTMIQVNLVSVTEQGYDEFLRGLPNPTVICIFSMAPLEGSALLEMNSKLVFTIFERLLGAKSSVETSGEARELSEIEQSVIEGVFERILTNLKDSWSNIVSLTPRVEALETNPLFSQIVAPNDRVASIVFEMRIGDATGVLNLCIPHLVVEPIGNKLSAQMWFASSYKAPTTESTVLIQKRLQKAVVPVVAELGSTTVTLREIFELQAGDVIRLDATVGDRVRVKLGEQDKFVGDAGVVRGHVAVRIMGRAVLEEA